MLFPGEFVILGHIEPGEPLRRSNTRNRVKNMDLASIAAAFGLTGQVERTEEICTGNINRTFEIAVRDERSGKVDRYIFQKLNTFVFQHPAEVMDNS